MGKILQIRVSAWTYDEREVPKAWPRLTKLVWSENEKWAPAGQKHGLMELVKALSDVVDIGNLSPELRAQLKAPTAKLDDLRKKLEQALADWQPMEANKLSEQLEEALTELDKSLPGESDR